MISCLRVWQAQGLIEEKRRLSCYELLEQFCVCVASNVSLLQNSSKCPDECREAISSLVYAAARVSEVPELCNLRSLFAERYGKSLWDPELVERFKAEPPSKEMKVELLQEIAREYSIKWDAKSLEQRLYGHEDRVNGESKRRGDKEDESSNSVVAAQRPRFWWGRGSRRCSHTKLIFLLQLPFVSVSVNDFFVNRERVLIQKKSLVFFFY